MITPMYSPLDDKTTKQVVATNMQAALDTAMEKFLPNYYQSEDVAMSDDLFKYLAGEMSADDMREIEYRLGIDNHKLTPEQAKVVISEHLTRLMSELVRDAYPQMIDSLMSADNNLWMRAHMANAYVNAAKDIVLRSVHYSKDNSITLIKGGAGAEHIKCPVYSNPNPFNWIPSLISWKKIEETMKPEDYKVVDAIYDYAVKGDWDGALNDPALKDVVADETHLHKVRVQDLKDTYNRIMGNYVKDAIKELACEVDLLDFNFF